MTCQTSIRLGLCAVSLALNGRAADKDDLPPVIPVKVAAVHRLPFFCIAEGLGEEKTPARLPESDYVAGDSCKPEPSKKKPSKSETKAAAEPQYVAVPPGNADEIATLLQPALPASGSASAPRLPPLEPHCVRHQHGRGGVHQVCFDRDRGQTVRSHSLPRPRLSAWRRGHQIGSHGTVSSRSERIGLRQPEHLQVSYHDLAGVEHRSHVIGVRCKGDLL